MDLTPRAFGFIGLGTMGLPMATNLIKHLPADCKLYAYDISQESLNRLKEAEASGRVIPCNAANEVINHADVLISIVPEGSHVRAVYLDEENGVLSGNLKNKILIDCSTIDTATSAFVAAEVGRVEKTASFYDAPVSGGSLGAQDGTLTFMVGSSTADKNWTLLEVLLKKMGKSIFPCGAQTMGLVAKLANNYCSSLIALATSEAMNMGIRSGMDPRILSRIFNASTAQSAICDKWCPVPGIVPSVPSSNGYKGGFKVQLMKKDIALAMEMGKLVDAKLFLGETGLAVYTGASNDPKCRDLDSRVVFRYIGGDENWASRFQDSCQ